MINGFINLLNSRLKFLGCEFVVPGEACLECIQLVLEVRDINVLCFDSRKFFFVLQ